MTDWELLSPLPLSPAAEKWLEGRGIDPAIAQHLAPLCKAFGMRVVATKRNPATAQGPADEVHPPDGLQDLLG